MHTFHVKHLLSDIPSWLYAQLFYADFESTLANTNLLQLEGICKDKRKLYKYIGATSKGIRISALRVYIDEDYSPGKD